MINLVTGFRNEPHITPSDDRSFNASVFGAGKYVLNRGSKFECEIISNNLIKIKDGDAINQGAHMRVEKNNYEEVTIDNGSQSLNRTDLIVLRYEKNLETKIETASIDVIKGTEAESPVMPEYETGNLFDGDYMDDMPLYAVKLEGINITSVEPLFMVAKSIPDLEEEIKQTNGKFVNPNLIKNGYFKSALNSITFDGIDESFIDKYERRIDFWDCNEIATIQLGSCLLFKGKKIITSSTEQLSASLYQELKNIPNDDNYTLSLNVEDIINNCDIQVIVKDGVDMTDPLNPTPKYKTLTFDLQTGMNIFKFEEKPTQININSYTGDNLIGEIAINWIKLELGTEATPCVYDAKIEADSGWIYPLMLEPFTNYSNIDKDNIRYRRKGNMIEIQGRFKVSHTLTGSSDNELMFKLAKEFVPNGNVYVVGRGYSNRIFGILVSNDGCVYFTKYMAPGNTSYVDFTTSEWGAFYVSYLI